MKSCTLDTWVYRLRIKTQTLMHSGHWFLAQNQTKKNKKILIDWSVVWWDSLKCACLIIIRIVLDRKKVKQISEM